MKHTTLHDLQDLLMIYKDHLDYKLVVWNYKDFKEERLRFTVMTSNRVHFETSAEPIPDEILTLGQLKEVVDDCYTALGDRSIEDRNIAVPVFNIKEWKPMSIAFSGSDNSRKTIHFTLSYIDQKFHEKSYKRKMFWMKLKWKLTKLTKLTELFK